MSGNKREARELERNKFISRGELMAGQRTINESILTPSLRSLYVPLLVQLCDRMGERGHYHYKY